MKQFDLNDTPFVSVCVQTYQHVNHIRKCLEGIICQRTSFTFEILIGEDGSTDGTSEICSDYQKNHPEKIRLFTHSRQNVIYIDGRATGRYNFMYNLGKARGKYIALCEGDDYWTDPLKLQKQVDFLENNPSYSMCFHNTYQAYDGKQELTFLEQIKSTYNTNDLIDKATIRTLSLVYRNHLFEEFPDWFKSAYIGDWPLVVILSTYGDAFYFKEPMGVYTLDGGGMWSGSTALFRLRAKENLYQSLLLYLGQEYHEKLKTKIFELWPSFSKQYFKEGDMPSAIRYFIKYLKAPWTYKKFHLKQKMQGFGKVLIAL